MSAGHDDQAEYDEQVEFARQMRVTLEHLPVQADKAMFLRAAEHLSAHIQGKASGVEVAALARQLRSRVIRASNVAIAPKRPPDLRAAPALYQEHCAACHGLQGQGDGPAGVGLNPRPSNVHEWQRLDQRSVCGLYNTITLGVQGMGLAGFQRLSEDERWTLAFYVSNFATPPVAVQRSAELWQAGFGRRWFPDLASAMTQSASEVRSTHGDETALGVYREECEPVLISQVLVLMLWVIASVFA